MTMIEGRLSGAKSGYAGHSVEAMISLGAAPPPPKKNRAGAKKGGASVELAGAGKADERPPAWQPQLFRSDVADDGRFTIDLDGAEAAGTIELVVRAPWGERIAETEVSKARDIDIAVKPRAAFALDVDPAPPASALGPVTVRIAVRNRTSGATVGGALVSVWETPAREADGAPMRVVVGAAHSDAAGRARIELPRRRYDPLTVEIAGDAAGRSYPLARDDKGTPQAELLIEAQTPAAAEHGDCPCEAEAPPRAPDHKDLVGVDGVYSSDLGGGCVSLTTPNRTIEEYNYTTLVRTTDPLLWGVKPRKYRPLAPEALRLLAGLSFGMNTIDSTLTTKSPTTRTRRAAAGNAAGAAATDAATQGDDDLRLSSEAYRNSGLLVSRAWRDAVDLDAAQKALAEKASGLSEEVLRQALSDPDGFTPTALMTAERRHSFEMVTDQLRPMLMAGGQRAPITATNAPQWEGNARTYQAATIAHGHVLGFRQVWKADGYSLGDLLYSLPLGPGQKRKIVVLDWDRREAAARAESRVATEDFSADLSRDRDVAEIVGSTISESIRAGSTAKTWGAGGGFGIGIPIGPGFLGLGVAGGGGGASSTAYQNSARALSASSSQHLSDRTQQAAAAVRSQRGTVVTSRAQDESVSVTSEVVANYNHCHAITIEYFEVLKHYRVDQELVSVRECLFVPLRMTQFDDLKALRWRDTLEDFLIDRKLRPAFDAAQRLMSGYADADFPPARYADEIVTELWGDFSVELSIARPRPQSEGEAIEDYLDNAWAFWDTLFGAGTAAQVFKTYLAGQDLADKIYADDLAPRLARTMFDNLKLELDVEIAGVVWPVPVTADFTMVSSYRPGREHIVSFKIHDLPFPMSRAMIKGVRIKSEIDLSPSSQSIMRSFRCSYRNAYRSFSLVSPRRIRDELRNGDQVFVSARSLSRAEEFNPRANDLVIRDALIKHLNEHIEQYHRLIWWRMDPGRRFMLLDGFIAPNSGGRSVASVTENRILDVVGNCIVLPVAPGYALDPLAKPPAGSDTPVDLLEFYRPPIPVPPRRISVPTRGVHAEAILGDCNSCEKHDNTRFWDWASEPTGDEPTEIGETSLESRKQAPLDTSLSDFPAPIIAIQNAPPAPDPTGFAPIAALLGQKDLFNDITGLEGNQKNALGAFQRAMQTANSFGKLAAAGAKTIHAQRNSERIYQKATEAHKAKQLNDADAKTVVGATVKAVNGDQDKPKQPLTNDAAVKKAIDQVANGSGKRSMEISSETGTGSQSVAVKFDGDSKPAPKVDFKVEGLVPAMAQEKSKGCWAAALTMIKSWERKQSIPIPVLLAEGGATYVQRFETNAGLSPADVAQLRADFDLKDATTPLTAAALADRLKERGPLWVIADEDADATFSVHARVVTGVVGDGTPHGTIVHYNDPSDGSTKSESLHAFIVKLEQLAQGVASTFGGPSLQMLSN